MIGSGDPVREQNGAGGDVGLVLGGGGARGAYAAGALSVLLPELKDQVSVIVGTSAGALISAYLAANWHRSADEAIDDGLRFWRELQFRAFRHQLGFRTFRGLKVAG
jgi:predicted acylesterase/phospholipase RssA